MYNHNINRHRRRRKKEEGRKAQNTKLEAKTNSIEEE